MNANAKAKANANPDIFKCIVKWFDSDECRMSIDIKLVAAMSGSKAYQRIEDYYGETLCSVEIEAASDCVGIYDLGTIEDADTVHELCEDLRSNPKFEPTVY